MSRRRFFRRSTVTFAVAAFAASSVAGVLAPADPAQAIPVTATRPALGIGGADPNQEILDANATPDGEWITYSSSASNLVTPDTNGKADVFITETATGDTIRIDPPGIESDDDSYESTICDDGSKVAFSSLSDLFGGDVDTNVSSDVYVYDRDTDDDGTFDEAGGTSLTRVSVDEVGFEGETGGYGGVISGDCTWVVFLTEDPLGSGDGNDSTDVYVHEAEGFGLSWISEGTRADGGGGFFPAISYSGRHVTFQSFATDIAPGGGGTRFGTYFRDRDTDNDGTFDESDSTTDEYVSVSSAELVSTGTPDSGAAPAITPDGRCVAFKFYNGFDLTADGVAQAIYVRDRTAGTTTLVSKNATGLTALNPSRPGISPDCTRATFDSTDPDLLADDDNPGFDVFLRDIPGAALSIISTTTTGGPTGGPTLNRNMIDNDTALLSSGAPTLGGATNTSGFLNPFLVQLPSDSTPPTLKRPALSPRTGWALGTTATYRGGATDANQHTTTVQKRVGPYTTPFGAWANSASATDTDTTVNASSTIREGQVICFRQTAVDDAGNTAGPSRSACASRPYSSPRISFSRGDWTRLTGARYYGSEARTTTKVASTAYIRGVRATKIAVVVSKCRRCGAIRVSFAGKTETVSLVGPPASKVVVVPIGFRTVKEGKVTVTVISRAKTVTIEGIGAIRPG